MQLRTQGEIIIYVWDYFYLQARPAEGDEDLWRRIECATLRIRQREWLLEPTHPPDVRLQAAKYILKDVRLTRRYIASLSEAPPAWTSEGFARLEPMIEALIREVSPAARDIVVH